MKSLDAVVWLDAPTAQGRSSTSGVRSRDVFVVLVLAVVAISTAGCKSSRRTATDAVPSVPSGKDGSPLPPPRRDAGTAVEDNPSEHSAADLAVAKRVEAALCDKGSCCVTGVWRLGPDRRGHPLAVVALESKEACLLPQKPSGDEPEESDDDRHACGEYRLVDLAAKKPRAGLKLTRRCDGDHSEGHAGPDVDARTFTYEEHSMFTNDQSWGHTVLGLDPLRIVEVSEGSSGRGVSHDETWNWDKFAGTVELGIDYCAGKAPWADGGTPPDSDMPDLVVEALRIPRVKLPPAFLANGWRTTALGRCAAEVDGENGFTVHGTKGPAADTSMRVLFSTGDDVFIEIRDDRFVSGGKSWVADDHLEIWTTNDAGRCVDPKGKSPVWQWGIRVLDGKVFPGFGDPSAAPRAEVQRAGDVVRLKIEMQGTMAGAFTVVYSDSDDGRHQKRLIATSALEYGKWWTFGETPSEQEGASCVAVRGTLEPRRPPLVLPTDD